MRQGGESGEMHDYSFGLAAFAPWRVDSTRLVPLPGVRRASTIGYGCGEGSHLIGMMPSSHQQTGSPTSPPFFAQLTFLKKTKKKTAKIAG